MIAKAVDHFWREGLRAVSLNQLCQVIGISKPGLYREFGGEDGLMQAPRRCAGMLGLRSEHWLRPESRLRGLWAPHQREAKSSSRKRTSSTQSPLLFCRVGRSASGSVAMVPSVSRFGKNTIGVSPCGVQPGKPLKIRVPQHVVKARTMLPPGF
ncbi:MAG: helix-turn-helix transcriptional regulator [Proteobacteria bacterium]|nr:helix-turn-helix transcriptional regulator [Pseudomonadota bacterium]